MASLIVLIGAAMLAVIRRQPLWADELFSLAMATGHSLEHPAEAASPAHGDFMESARPQPPLFYSLLPGARLVRDSGGLPFRQQPAPLLR